MSSSRAQFTLKLKCSNMCIFHNLSIESGHGLGLKPSPLLWDQRPRPWHLVSRSVKRYWLWVLSTQGTRPWSRDHKTANNCNKTL